MLMSACLTIVDSGSSPFPALGHVREYKTVAQPSIFAHRPQRPFLILTRLTTWIVFGIHTSCHEDTMIDRRTLCALRLFGNSADSVLPGSPRLNRSARSRKLTHLLNKAGLGQSAASDNGQRD
jgi:hypothetical protein